MSDSFITIFDEAYKLRTNYIEELDQPRIIASPYAQQEYILTHRYKDSPNTFLCQDLAKNNMHFKVIPCKNYSEVKLGVKKLTKILGQCQSNAILENDLFDVLDEGRWFLIMVTPTMKAVSLAQFSEAMHKKGLEINKEYCVGIMLRLISLVEEIQQQGSDLNCIFPNSIYICKSNAGAPLFTIEDQAFSLKISATKKHTLLGIKNTLQNLYIEDNTDLWGISMCIYALCGSVLLSSLPNMINLCIEDRMAATPLKHRDPALERIFRMAQENNRKIFTHKYLEVWKGFCDKNWELVEKSDLNDLEVLHSGLLFSNSGIKTLVVQKWLNLWNSFHNVYIYLNENDLFLSFIEECLKMDWSERKDLLEAFFKMLKQKPKDSVFKEKLGGLGILGLVYTTVSLDPHNQAFYFFVKDYMSENTLTLMQVLYDSGVITKTLDLAKSSKSDKSFIRDTMSYYGPHSPKLIEQVYGMELFSPVIIIQGLVEIPHYHKMEKLDQILELNLQILSKKYRNEEMQDVLKNTLDLITEILFLPSLIQRNHLLGKCSTHEIQEIFELSKNPFLYYCRECAVPLCSSCLANTVHKTHNVYNLLYMTPHFRCNCSDFHNQEEFKPSDFAFPKTIGRFHFLPSNSCPVPETLLNKFTSKSDMVITTMEHLVKEWSNVGTGLAAYYEVKVNKAGKYENIVIGILGADIYYHGVNGNFIVNNKLACKAPRFGSYDTIGIGILRNSKAFITYNGLLCSNLVECEANQELKIEVSLYGDGCEVEIKLRGFLFQSAKFGTETFQKASSKDIFEKILKTMLKSFRKLLKFKNERLEEIKERFKNILSKIQREKLASKL